MLQSLMFNVFFIWKRTDVNLTTNTQSLKCYHDPFNNAAWSYNSFIPCEPLSCTFPPPGKNFIVTLDLGWAKYVSQSKYGSLWSFF